MPDSNRRDGFARGSPTGSCAGACAHHLDVDEYVEDLGRTTTDHTTVVAVN